MTTGGAVPDFLPCMVSDAGGFDDKSFNQCGFEGATAAADELGVELTAVQSDAETDYAPNITNLVDQGCDLIVTVGFELSAATVESATRQPRHQLRHHRRRGRQRLRRHAPTPTNIKPLLFDTAQAAFLAGYAAAGYSKTGVVGTFGGMHFPTVTIFMDGFAQGVEYYNDREGHRRQGPRLGPRRTRRRVHRWLRGERHRRPEALRRSSTRAPT